MKSLKQKLHDAVDSHSSLLAEAKQTLEDIGGCDHSVGICCCALERKIKNGENVQARLLELYQSIKA